MTDFASLSTPELITLKVENQQIGASMTTFRRKATARGNVRKINEILRARGALVDAKARQATKDTTGLVAAAVAPLKDAAVEYNAKLARESVDELVAKYVGRDLNVAAPMPNSNMSRAEYLAAAHKRSHLKHIMGRVPPTSYRTSEPFILTRLPEREDKYIEEVRRMVAADFDSYVAKLEGKIGQGVTAVTVEGRYLWQGSTLIVQKGDQTERWHTQQIANRSVLGKFFNQWPTRKMK